MKIAVVTPYHQEPIEWLRQCHESVLAQHDVQADHILVADGFARNEIDSWPTSQHVRLPCAHADNGNTPRAVGSVLARTQGYDFIAYLDADNWFHPEHLTSLLALWQQTGVPVCCAWRTFHRPDGSAMDISEEEESRMVHVDTSAYLIHRRAFEALSVWAAMPKPLAPVCDRVFFKALRHRRYAMAFSQRRTVAFRSLYEQHYQALREVPPPGAKGAEVFKACWDFLASADGISESVEQLGFWPRP